MKKVFSVMLVALLALAMLAGCSGGGPKSGAQDDADTIVIGGLAPLTGNVSQYGIAAYNGAQIAVDEINEAGGVLGKDVTFICEDEKGDPTEAINAYNKLVENDKIVALVGDVTTKPTIAVAQKAAQDGTPMITPTGTGAEITEIGDNIFRACFTDPYQGELMAYYAQDKTEAKTAAVLYDTGDDYSQGVADAFKETAEEIGIDVLSYEGYQTGATDFNSQLTKIKEANPDVVMAPCYYEDAAMIIQQARDLGITATFLGPDGWDGILNQMDESNFDVLNNSFYCGQYAFSNPNEALQNWMDAYLEKFDGDDEYLNMFAVLGYEAMHLMAAAIEEAGSTEAEAIIAALKNLEYEGISGTISFLGGNDPAREAYVIEFVDGKEEITGTYAIPGADANGADDASDLSDEA